ncbi:hypothetical protein G7Y89_g7341 [Cudoniella acicularis]|uniref:Uncharacterized protein n=1 Tax=Cudoniella acicularis TaxID=354080 RepID=A0A8H4RLE4_9HELO|nr:hypothetical protein G7Y89_g7341 [Cudoniella acicularis]
MVRSSAGRLENLKKDDFDLGKHDRRVVGSVLLEASTGRILVTPKVELLPEDSADAGENDDIPISNDLAKLAKSRLYLQRPKINTHFYEDSTGDLQSLQARGQEALMIEGQVGQPLSVVPDQGLRAYSLRDMQELPSGKRTATQDHPTILGHREAGASLPQETHLEFYSSSSDPVLAIYALIYTYNQVGIEV